MDNTESIDSSISIDDFFQNIDWLSLRDGLASFDHFGEVTSITKLSDNAGMWL